MTTRSQDARRSTVVDVARAAGVSRQTVSNVINAPDKVAPGTRERVHAAIEALDFRVNLTARSLRRQRAGALGIEVTPVAHRSLGNVLDPFLAGLTSAAGDRDTHLVTFLVGEDRVTAYRQLLATTLVDGFVLTNTGHDDPRPQWLRAHGVPFASFGRVWDDPSFTTWVDVDGAAGLADAVAHVREQGYGAVGFLGWPEGSPVGDDRRAGWERGCRDTGAFDADLHAETEQEVHAAAAAAGPLLDRIGVGGALVCASDTLALGASLALRDRGLRPGSDVGLVGFDDSDLAGAFDFTTLHQPLDAIAAALVDMVLALEAGEAPPADGLILAPELVRRASTDRSPSATTQPAEPPPAGNRNDDGGTA